MIRRILKIAIVLLVANALYRVTPVVYHHTQFVDALQELALYGQKSSDAVLVSRALELAAENGVPLEKDNVGVRRESGALHIDAAYIERIRLLPGYTYAWEFDVDAKALELAGAAAH